MADYDTLSRLQLFDDVDDVDDGDDGVVSSKTREEIKLRLGAQLASPPHPGR